MFGQTLIPSPLKPRKIRPSVRINGRAWLAGRALRRQIHRLRANTRIGTGTNQEEIGQRKPAFRHVAPAQRRPDADHRDHHHQRQQYLAGQLAHPLLQRAFAFIINHVVPSSR
ncbi:Uncharacterised protein [Klebsiella pneumoniae]|uniref:Uncharacterized protein n=1 Tax=Klebsiella pneumoniae TaxID=573 RepID=A0A2X3HGN1_KLEPN|nr:Uncharacterised protein [Klebsiella pneumoniae]